MEQNLKKEFIEFEILTWTIVAGFSRGKKVYDKKIIDPEKEPLKKFLRDELRNRFGSKYNPDSEHHIVNIRKLKEDIDSVFSSILNGQKIYFGRIQKIVNLYLKYRWSCFDEQKPIHCPVDSIVLKKLGLSNIRWTEMTKEEYRGIIKKAEDIAGGFEKIAEWELTLFNAENTAYTR